MDRKYDGADAVLRGTASCTRAMERRVGAYVATADLRHRRQSMDSCSQYVDRLFQMGFIEAACIPVRPCSRARPPQGRTGSWSVDGILLGNELGVASRKFRHRKQLI